MYRLIRIMAVAAGLCLFAPIHPVAAADLPRFTGAQLHADAAILRRAYETLHPGLHRYATEAQWNHAYEDLLHATAAGGTLASAYASFSRFLGTIECGHTYANPLNQTAEVAAALYAAPRRIPFWFRWVGERMIVTRGFGDRLRPGTEILALDGHAAGDVLRALLPFARADGSNDAKRRSNLSVNGTDADEPFDIFYPLVFEALGETVDLRIREATGVATTGVRIPTLTREARNAPIAARLAAAHGDVPLWTFATLDANTGLLVMPTFATFNSTWDYKAFLETVFAQLNRDHIGKFIIDVRGNEGGTDVGGIVASHLIARELPMDRIERRVSYRRVPDDLTPYLATWDRSFRDWGAAAVARNDGMFRLMRPDERPPGAHLLPRPPMYGGRVVVLVDSANSSATFQFAQLMQSKHLATLVGEPTGGNQRGINGGAFFFLTLPETKIEFDLPLIGTYPTKATPDAGIVPDLFVAPKPADIDAGYDSALEAARALLADH